MLEILVNHSFPRPPSQHSVNNFFRACSCFRQRFLKYLLFRKSNSNIAEFYLISASLRQRLSHWRGCYFERCSCSFWSAKDGACHVQKNICLMRKIWLLRSARTRKELCKPIVCAGTLAALGNTTDEKDALYIRVLPQLHVRQLSRRRFWCRAQERS